MRDRFVALAIFGGVEMAAMLMLIVLLALGSI
jgi:hypothetical protein